MGLKHCNIYGKNLSCDITPEFTLAEVPISQTIFHHT